jgi:hypothetical protein
LLSDPAPPPPSIVQSRAAFQRVLLLRLLAIDGPKSALLQSYLTAMPTRTAIMICASLAKAILAQPSVFFGFFVFHKFEFETDGFSLSQAIIELFLESQIYNKSMPP